MATDCTMPAVAGFCVDGGAVANASEAALRNSGSEVVSVMRASLLAASRRLYGRTAQHWGERGKAPPLHQNPCGGAEAFVRAARDLTHRKYRTDRDNQHET